MSTGTIQENIKYTRLRIQTAAEKAGRRPDGVKLIAVSKTVTAEAVSQALPTGQIDFGENRVQELAKKADVLPTNVVWHMIGHLQQNKVRQAIQHASWIHSVDSLDLLDRINRIALEEDRTVNVLCQVNVSGEETKTGATMEDAERIVATAATLNRVDCQGLMTMAPYGGSDTNIRSCFAALRSLRDTLQDRLGQKLPELSMGMSGDFELAIAEGATMVRIGTAVFGHRH